MSCDHHDASGSVPDNRSRKRMLEQFGHAAHFGEAFLEMVRESDLHLLVAAREQLLPLPTVNFKADRFLDAWAAFCRWERNQPRGDDLAPAVDPPAEIRVPDIDG